MIKKKSFIIPLVIIFLITEAALGILFQISEIKKHDMFGFALVILACLFCALFFKKNKRYIFTQAAFIFTVGADYFLLVKDDRYTVGVILFLFAQMFYMLRIISDTKSIFLIKTHIIIRIAVSISAIFIPCIILGENADALSIISVVYYANLILNTAFAFVSAKSDKCALVFAIGLLLFVGCDLFVGIDNLSSYIEVKNGSLLSKILSSDLNIAWIFYTPSQALLAISLLPYIQKDKQNECWQNSTKTA